MASFRALDHPSHGASCHPLTSRLAGQGFSRNSGRLVRWRRRVGQPTFSMPTSTACDWFPNPCEKTVTSVLTVPYIYILVFDGSEFKIHVHYFVCIHFVVFDVLSFDRVAVDFYEVVDVSLVV